MPRELCPPWALPRSQRLPARASRLALLRGQFSLQHEAWGRRRESVPSVSSPLQLHARYTHIYVHASHKKEILIEWINQTSFFSHYLSVIHMQQFSIFSQMGRHEPVECEKKEKEAQKKGERKMKGQMKERPWKPVFLLQRKFWRTDRICQLNSIGVLF